MLVTKYENKTGHLVLCGLITQAQVAAAVAPHWDGELFPDSWSNVVAGWAVDYWNTYHKPIGKQVETSFNHWARVKQDQAVVEPMEKFLRWLSDRYSLNGHAPPPQFVIDEAQKLFEQTRLRNMAEAVQFELAAGKLARAKKAYEKFKPVEIGSGCVTKLGREGKPTVKQSFLQEGSSLMTWGQPALTKFFEGQLNREAFVAFMGKEKVGKSFWLQELAWQGVQQGLRVAFFEVGDQSEHQIIRRFGARAAGRPFRSDLCVKVPTAVESNGPTQEPTLEYEEKKYDRPMTWQEAYRAFKSTPNLEENFRLSVHPNSTITVSGIHTILDRLKKDGWTPDVIVVDYSDILAPMNGTAETRDQINHTWKALRCLSQKWHALVVTATQADAGSYEVSTLSRKNFSEDKRKYSHVTAMVGINQKDEEKKKGLMRLNMILARDYEFSESDCVWCAGCLALANPSICSTF